LLDDCTTLLMGGKVMLSLAATAAKLGPQLVVMS
jgi:hypothetical protein